MLCIQLVCVFKKFKMQHGEPMHGKVSKRNKKQEIRVKSKSGRKSKIKMCYHVKEGSY